MPILKLKFLQFPIAACAIAALLGACAGAGKADSPAAAEKFAVSLANGKCLHEFGKRPFKTGAFPATRSGDRWLWGWLDAKETQGCTAQVSFHADQSEPVVDVRFGADSQVDTPEPDAPSLNGNGDPTSLSGKPAKEVSD